MPRGTRRISCSSFGDNRYDNKIDRRIAPACRGYSNGEELAPEVAGTCKNASLASATIVRIPDPRFPRLKSDASPYLVKADGTYKQVRGGDFDVSLPAIKSERIVGRIPNYNTRKVRVQLSHWSQLLALPLTAQVALASADNTRKAR